MLFYRVYKTRLFGCLDAFTTKRIYALLFVFLVVCLTSIRMTDKRF